MILLISSVGWLFFFLPLFSHPRLLSCYCLLSGVGWLLFFLHLRLLSCYCSLYGVGYVLAPPAPLLLLLAVWCWLVAHVIAPPAPLLLLLAVWCWRREDTRTPGSSLATACCLVLALRGVSCSCLQESCREWGALWGVSHEESLVRSLSLHQ